MHICLIGHSLPSLILANILINKNIKVSIFDLPKSKKKINTRTLSIVKHNKIFLNKEKINLEKISWGINRIKIFNEKNNSKEILSFGGKKKELFYIVKNLKFIDFDILI